MSNLFFELIRISIRTEEQLSSIPSAKEWFELFALAEKHAIIGICFNGVQYLNTKHPEQTTNLPVQLRMQWLGVAVSIQKKNELLNKRCAELQDLLMNEGFKTSILKGQGVATLYRPMENAELCSLRQSGDIDIYVEGGIERSLQYCKGKFGDIEYDYVNAHAPFFNDAEVELHWRPFVFTNLWRNHKAELWLKNGDVQKMITGGTAVLSSGQQVIVPEWEFNAFYLMQHCYHHMFESGLGLRQLMDYYFLLRSTPESCDHSKIESLFRKFGMMRFASAVMWILQNIFKLESKYLICCPDEHEGRFILNEVMAGGNFGHHDTRIKKISKGKIQFLFINIQHNWHLATHYPSEFFWGPIWLGYHWFWKRLSRH